MSHYEGDQWQQDSDHNMVFMKRDREIIFTYKYDGMIEYDHNRTKISVSSDHKDEPQHVTYKPASGKVQKYQWYLKCLLSGYFSFQEIV